MRLLTVVTVVYPISENTRVFTYMDSMAQAYCASKVSTPDWVFAVFRNCPVAPTCNDICAEFKTQLLELVDNRRTK